VQLDFPDPVLTPGLISGEVLFVDRFGNLITNIPAAAYAGWADRPVRVTAGDREVTRRVRTYGEAAPGTLVALTSSVGALEVAVVQGNAANQLGLGAGAPVVIQPLNSNLESRNPKQIRNPNPQ